MVETAKERYSRIIHELGQIPTMPSIAARVMQIVNNPSSSSDDLANFLSRDVALTSKVLRLANSAFYGIPRSISSVNSAIVILGFNTIRSLVLSASILKAFPTPSKGASFDRKEFWKHCFMVGVAARMLARHYRRKKMVDLEIVFSAGLMHDIGKLILDQFAHDDYMTVLMTAREKGIPIYVAEREGLGMTHAEVSGMLVEKWQMPAELIAPIIHHHSPLDAGPHTDVAILVHIANHLCHLKGSGCMENETFGELNIQAFEQIDLGVSLEDMLLELDKQIEEAGSFFSLIESG